MNTITSMPGWVDRVVRAFRRTQRAAALARRFDAVHRAVAGIHVGSARLRRVHTCGPAPIAAGSDHPLTTALALTTRRLDALND